MLKPPGSASTLISTVSKSVTSTAALPSPSRPITQSGSVSLSGIVSLDIDRAVNTIKAIKDQISVRVA